MSRIFEWDDAKNQSTLDDRNIDFETAKRVWDDPNRLVFEKKNKGSEDRWVLVGMIGGDLHTVVYTIRGENIYRIISARRSKPTEESVYIRKRDRYMLESGMAEKEEDILKDFKLLKRKAKFKDEYLRGEISFNEIDRYVSDWKHDHRGEILQDYLGLDDEEFKAFKNGSLEEKLEKSRLKPTGSLLLKAISRIVKKLDQDI